MEEKIKIGDNCLVLKRNPNDHRRRSAGMGTMEGDPETYIKITNICNNGMLLGNNGNNYYSYELKKIVKNKNYYLEKIEKHRNILKDSENKIEFLERFKIEEYSKEKFKIYRGLLKSKGKSLGEKVEIIDKYLK